MLGFDLTNKRVLEVGCGMALVSHVLNALGADVTAMDIHPVTEELITSNATLNDAPRIPFLNASWGDDTSALGEFDLIIGSDILYEPKHIKTLAAFLDCHARAGSEVLIVDPDRGQLDEFQADMLAASFSCETFSPDFEDHLGVAYRGSIHRYSRQRSSGK
jgi:predicted nicotinamide N-methyase